MKWYYYLQNVQDFLADGKSQNERRFGESFKGPVILLDALIGYLPKLRERERESTNSSICKAIITKNLSRICFDRGWIWEEQNTDCWYWRIGKVRCIRNIHQKTECERSPDNPKRRTICISYGRWFSKIIRKKLRIPRTHSETGIHRKERISAENLMAIGKSFNLKKQKVTQKLGKIFGLFKEISCIVIILNRQVQLYVPRKESYPTPLSNIDVIRATYADLETAQRSEFMTIGISIWTEICQIRGRVSTIFTLLSEVPQKGNNQSERRLTKIQTTSRPDYIWLAIPCKRPYSRTCIRETVVPKRQEPKCLR